jgi:hypothetical protein
VVAIALLGAAVPAFGVPAFARKYNLRCSDCHEAWPKLNNFGQTFKDNGYQLMTGRDAPIYLPFAQCRCGIATLAIALPST